MKYILNTINKIPNLKIDNKIVRNWLIFSIFFHILAMFFSVGYHQHDEHWQILEYANMKAGKITPEHLPWEYDEKMRSGLQPWIVVQITNGLSFLGLRSPYVTTFVLRFISGALSLFVSWWLIFSQFKYFKTQLVQKIALISGAIFWFLPYLHVRFSSENWSSIFFVWAFILVIREVKKPGILSFNSIIRAVFIGVLLGLVFLFRFSAGFLIAGLLLWMFFINKPRRMESILIGVFTVLTIITAGLLVDYWMYGTWTITGWNFFYADLVHKKLAMGQVIPWYFYFPILLVQFIPPYSFILLPVFFIFFIVYKKHALTWSLVPFLLMHIFIWHKELRYLFPIAFCLPLILAYMVQYSQSAYGNLFSGIQNNKAVIFTVKSYLILNMIGILVASIKPANDAIYFYSDISKKYSAYETTLYSYKTEFYKTMHLEMSYYRPESLSETMVSSPIELFLLVQKELLFNKKKVLIGFEGFDWPSEISGLKDKCKVTVTSLPSWMKSLNFNNWQSRTRIWNIAECSL